MYNEELKQRFIDFYTGSENMKKLCRVVFNKVAKYEEEWQADVCSVSTEQLQPMVDSIVGFRSRSKWSTLVILKAYTKWCIGENIPYACDAMLKINSIGVGNLKTKMVSFPMSLQNYLDEICAPESLQATDNIYRCFYWLAYMGMPEEDIMRVRTSDVNFDNLTIIFNGKSYDIYKEALPALKNCVNLGSFYFNHPNYAADKQVWKPRVEGDLLLRGIRGSCTVKSMRTALVKLVYDYTKTPVVRKTEMQLSYHRVWLSGIFFRMYEKEMSGKEVDFEPAALQFMEGRKYNYENSGGKNQNIKKREVAKDYLEDYQRWKLAFFL